MDTTTQELNSLSDNLKQANAQFMHKTAALIDELDKDIRESDVNLAALSKEMQHTEAWADRELSEAVTELE
ncbi:MAG: hypothetical protein AAB948_02860 [Patescibacteria group bacterium]